MKVEILNEKSIKITLKEAELLNRNVDVHTLLKENSDEKIVEIFKDILVDVDEQYGYGFTNCQGVYMEAHVNPENECELFVTKYEQKKRSSVHEMRDYKNFRRSIMQAMAAISRWQN